MTQSRTWRGWVLCGSMAVVLVGCGGGGDAPKPPVPKPEPKPEAPTVAAKQWQMSALTDASVALVPGGGYGLDTPNALSVDWLGFNPSTNLLDTQQASYSGGAWQSGAGTGMADLPVELAYAPFHVAKAGEWTIIRLILGNTLYARFDGPGGVTSGFVPISTTAAFVGWAAVDASGVARLYWSETFGATAPARTGHFDGIHWIDDGVHPDMSMYGDAVVAGPDGKGWLFYSAAGAGADVYQYTRTIDALDGLGVPVRLDDPALGSTGLSVRNALAENSTTITSVTLQSGAYGECLAVRRLSAGAWSPVQCVNASLQIPEVAPVYELAVEAGGRALITWSDGSGGLYANVRLANGVWLGAKRLASGEVLSSLHPQIDSHGGAIVVYRSTASGGPAVLKAAQFDPQTQAWGAVQRVDATEASQHIRVAVAYNSRGEPGVMSFGKLNGAYEVHVSTFTNSAWRTVATPAEFVTQPVFPYDIATIQRLIAFGDGGWAAFWEVKSPAGSGARRLMVATYQ